VEQQVVAIFSGVRGYLDGIPVANIGRYEQGLLDEFRSKHSGILNKIRTEGEISKDTEKQLTEIIGAFTKSFA
jgi:F-type H+-transporting ATPase subunit alpha